MELNQSGYSISELCKCARISISSYYKWLNRKETQRDKENKEISNEIIKIYSEVKGMVLCQYFGHKKSNFFMLHF